MALRRSHAIIYDGDGSAWELLSSDSSSSESSSDDAVPGAPVDGAAAASGVSAGGVVSGDAAGSAADPPADPPARREPAMPRFKWATRLRNPGHPMNRVEKPKRNVQFQRDWEQSRLEFHLKCRPQEGMDVRYLSSSACKKYAALAALMHKKGWKVRKPAKCQVPEMMHLVDAPQWCRVSRQLPDVKDMDFQPIEDAQEPRNEDEL